MKRKNKNILMIIILIIMIGCTVGTMFYVKEHASNTNMLNMDNNHPSMPNGDNGPGGTSPDMNNSGNTPPEKPDGDNNDMTPPDMNNNDNNNTPPEKPNDDNQSDNTPSEKPSEDDTNNMTSSDTNNNNSSSNTNNNEIKDNNMLISTNTNNNSLDTIYYVIFGIEGLIIVMIVVYLIMSNFNRKTFKETFSNKDKILIYILFTIIFTTGVTCGNKVITEKYFMNNNSIDNYKTNMSSDNNVSSSAVGKVEITEESTDITEDIETSDSDTSIIVVKDGGSTTINGSTLTKNGGDSSNTENSEFYGINAGVLVTSNSTLNIKKANISTNAKGSNAVFATGENAKIYISDTTIKTTGSSSSRGLDATYGGYIEADNVDITTQGGSCATLATDRGEGTVIAKNSKLETNGSGSPVIYSTGDISIENTTGTANGSQMVVIEGKNSATVTNSTLKASGAGNRNNVDQAGIMIYQSMSGDASEGTGTFTSTNSTLEIMSNSDYYKSAPMFFITNTDAVINLTNTKLIYGSNTLISIKGTSEWGNNGSNGGNLEFNATSEELVGNIEVDNISTLNINLTKSTYKGTINKDNTAKEITLKLDKNSKITLTGDSYVTSLDDSDSTYSNIDFNGYKLYVNGKAIN